MLTLWREPYTQQFLDLVHQYNNTITLLLSGHIHTSGVLVVDMQTPVKLIDSFVPSISPIYGNNPSYKIYTVNPQNFQLLNIKTYYLNLKGPDFNPSWQEEHDANYAVALVLNRHCER